MSVCRATIDDAAALAALTGQLGYPVEADEQARRLALVLASERDAVFVAVTADDRVVHIVSEDQRAGKVIRRLRSLLKQGQISLVPLDLNEIVRIVLQLTRSDLIWQSVTGQTSLAENLPLASGDHIQLQQVLLNLILNGCDAMAGKPADSRHLKLATAHSDGTVRVSVGTPAAACRRMQQHVFSRRSTQPRTGAGPGLSICTSIVRAHKGRLWGEACRPGDIPQGATGGATFHLELPAWNGGKP